MEKSVKRRFNSDRWERAADRDCKYLSLDDHQSPL
jgi:hypothetical protein